MVDIGWLFEELSRVLNAELSFLMGAMRWGFIALAMIFAATFALRGSQRLGDYFRDWVQWLLFGGAALFLIVAAVITVLSASDGATSFGNSTNVNTTVAYELDEYQWDDLKDVSREIASANSYDEALDIARSYGLVDDDLRLDSNMSKKVRLASGIETSVQIIGIYQDDLGNGGKAGLTFAFVDAIAEHAMNSDESTNSGGWEDSDMRRWLNGDFIEQLPSDLLEVIEPAEKQTNNDGQAISPSCVSETIDRLWLLSVSECVGDPSVCDVWSGDLDYLNDIAVAEGGQYKLFKDAGITAVSGNSGVLARVYAPSSSVNDNVTGISCQWWLRSPSSYRSDHFASEFAGGEPDGNVDARSALGVVPCFCI